MLVALLLLLAPQDPVDDLIHALQGDDPAAREQATKDLASRGESVRPRVEALLKSDDVELAARARMILTALDDAKKLREIFGEPRTYEVHAKDELLTDVLKKFRDEAKFPLTLLLVPRDARITIDFKAATPFEVVDAICDASGQIQFDARSQTVKHGKTEHPSRTYREHWGVYLPRLASARKIIGAPPFAEIDLAWDTVKAPSIVRAEFSKIIADNGETLKPVDGAMDDFKAPPGDVRALYLLKGFAPPTDQAKTVTLCGTAHFDYTIEDGELKFENPRWEEKPSKQTEIGEFQVTTFDRRQDGRCAVVVDFRPNANVTSHVFKERAVLTARLVDSDGKTYSENTVSSHRMVDNSREFLWQEFSLRFDVAKEKTIDRLEIVYPKRIHTVDVPFEFKDVPLKP